MTPGCKKMPSIYSKKYGKYTQLQLKITKLCLPQLGTTQANEQRQSRTPR
jgi:hypothetical protein